MEDAGAPRPEGLGPFVFVLVDGVDEGEGGEGGQRGLFGGLAGEEAGRVAGQDDPDGEAGMVGFESGYDEWQLHDCDGTARGEKEMPFAIVESGGEGGSRVGFGFVVGVGIGIIGHSPPAGGWRFGAP